MFSPRLLILVLLFVSATRGFCDGVSVIRVSDGKVVAKDRPSHSLFVPSFCDMVLNTSDASGKVAIIQWGHMSSTIKILDITTGKCKKRSIPIGRSNGLDGPDYYDFTSDEFIFHDQTALHFFGKSSEPRAVSNPVPNGYRTGTMVPFSGGFLIEAGNFSGDYRGAVVYCYQRRNGSMKQIYQTPEGFRNLGSGGDCAIVVEDIKGDYTNKHIVRVGWDGQILSKVKVSASGGERIEIKTHKVYRVGRCGGPRCQLQELNPESGAVLQKVEFPDVPGEVADFDLESNIAVVHQARDSNNPAYVVQFVDIKTKKVLHRFITNELGRALRLMKYNREIYCVFCD